MPNLENLKKKAKRYVRWHRDGYFPVAAQIRAHVPRFAAQADRDILAAPFQLSDAQDLVARQSGFESWTALIEGIKHMASSSTPEAETATIVASEAQVFVSDMDAALAFYAEKLGFKVEFTYGEPAFYAQVVRDGGRLNLRKVSGAVFDPGLRAREGDVLSATFALDDAKPLYLEYLNRGVAFHQALRTEPWGARTFIVADPDGNLLAFAGAGE
jgi:catechol 2,3-dioxygenase-like lactoylglutathione lyase family enzyme